MENRSMKTTMRLCLLGFLAVTGQLASAAPQSHRLADSAWNFGEANDPISLWARQEAAALTKRLCGQPANVVGDLSGPLCILVGTPENNRCVKQAAAGGLVDIARLATDDHYLKHTSLNGTPVLIIAGTNSKAVMYGVFDFFEQLGCRFLISRDLIPEARRDLYELKPVKGTNDTNPDLFEPG